MQKTLHYVLIA